MRRARNWLPLEGIVAAFVGTLLSAAVVGAHGGDPSMLHGCQGQGTLRLVAPGEECLQGESAYDWKIQGPAGPQGAPGTTGDRGASGARGPDGPQGSAGPEHRFRVATALSAHQWYRQSARVTCAAGERAVAGGMSSAGSPAVPLASHRAGDSGAAWQVRAESPLNWRTRHWNLTAYAVCMQEVPR